MTWHNQSLLWVVAIGAVTLLVGSWLLTRRQKGKRNRAAVVCVVLSIALHGLLIYWLPFARSPGIGNDQQTGPAAGNLVFIEGTTFLDETMEDSVAEQAEYEDAIALQPLPLESLSELAEVSVDSEPDSEVPPISVTVPEIDSLVPHMVLPAADTTDTAVELAADELISELLGDFQSNEHQTTEAHADETVSSVPTAAGESSMSAEMFADPNESSDGQPSGGVIGRVIADVPRDFANRRGLARQHALYTTGGDDRTEEAVQRAVEWLKQYQRDDGSWDPQQSGAGIERSVAGVHREGAGGKATTGISGLALLAMLGAGNTHQEGAQQDSVRSGLQYLLSVQLPSGALFANADPYARTYSHGMATLAMCEAAAMTADPVARDSASRGVGYTVASQHPTSGGWRYVAGDRGDMSQHGWQVMVMVSGRAAGVAIPETAFDRARTFLRTVRAGKTGGLASYRPGEAPSRTMTAEALATRLMLGEKIPPAELAEAQAFILEEMPGTGTDNYYYWYYASLALHQLQNDAWRQWNERMKERLLATQLPDGSWSTATVWGGHGGKVYTTAMACLCLEVYYRHLVSDARGEVATRSESQFIKR